MAKVGRPTGSKNKPKEKTLENFGMSRDSEADTERKIEGIMRACKDETVTEMKEHLTMVMEEIRNEMMEEIKKQMIEERKERAEERKREREEWSKEKGMLERRIAELEWFNERKERNERRNNIVIRGVSWKTENLEQEITEYIKENIEVNVEIKRAKKIEVRGSKEIIIAEINKWEQKNNVLKKKNKLKKGIIIENDLTRKEREIRGLRELAREEREKGDGRVKVGYQKIYMRGKWHSWNEKKEKLEERGGGKE